MLATKFRFHGYGALKFLFGHGRTYRFKSMSLRVAANSRRVHTRISVGVSKKVIKSAPKRNRVRRRVYESLRLNWDHILPGYDILISIYDPRFYDMPANELGVELQKSFTIARVWIDELPKNTS